jgi:hypothetical protein
MAVTEVNGRQLTGFQIRPGNVGNVVDSGRSGSGERTNSLDDGKVVDSGKAAFDGAKSEAAIL